MVRAWPAGGTLIEAGRLTLQRSSLCRLAPPLRKLPSESLLWCSALFPLPNIGSEGLTCSRGCDAGLAINRRKNPGCRRNLLAMTSLFVLACASEPEKIWYKAGATQADFNRSSSYCVKYAGVSGQPTKAEMARLVTCMQNDGWAQVPKPKGTPTQIQ
jgi:hypothetical protein